MQLTEFRSRHPEGADRLAEKLDELLLDLQIYQENVRLLHWNRQLRPFFELSPKLNLLDRATHDNTYKVAEHMLSMGYTPSPTEHGMGLMLSRVTPMNTSPTDVNQSLEDLIDSCAELLETVHDVWQLAHELQEPHTLEFMTKMSAQLRYAMFVFGNTRLALNN
ncbi:MAG: hypothetical protein NWR72_17675 [Bacteroidia bacterium]|nr:hypothetical protein [Bacteroidia bacterium]